MSGESVISNFLTNVDISNVSKEQKTYDEIANFAINVVRAMLDIDPNTSLYIDVPLDANGDILIERENYFGVYFE